MPKVVLIICGLAFAFSVSAKESIRGHYDVVGNVPAAHSLKKVVYEEFMNFGCPHCNNLHKASRNFRKKFADTDKVEFIDIPIVFRGQDDSPLRLYYVAKKIGKADLIKDELFKASFTHGVNVFDPGITNYLARSLGINKEFQKEKDQAWVNQLIKEGERKAAIYGVTGTPTVVIQHALKMKIGPYGTMAGFVKKVPETIADLTQ
ncbi:MAG TPA: disulfide bond formation protein DsbA [Candidatus Lambdaproteobacteria bacterium]|nr:disulfide bond formation protein DsbA [Candidatus Lambdaproteobacteria bacterium]